MLVMFMVLAILQVNSLGILNSVSFKKMGGGGGIYNQFLCILSPKWLQNDAVSYVLYYFSQATLNWKASKMRGVESLRTKTVIPLRVHKFINFNWWKIDARKIKQHFYWNSLMPCSCSSSTVLYPETAHRLGSKRNPAQPLLFTVLLVQLSGLWGHLSSFLLSCND